jgi:DNA-binding CsgD family transcriptional regulator
MSSTTTSPHTGHRRALAAVHEVCAAASTTRELLEGVGAVARDVLRAEGSFLCTTDPVSGVLNAEAVVFALPDDMRYPWMRNEFLDDDANKFGDLHRDRRVAATLQGAVRDRGEPSLRDTTVNRRFGYGPELRGVFARADACWGVINLLRTAGSPEFTDDDLAWLGEIRDAVVDGLQRIVLARTLLGPEMAAPGVVMLDPDGRIVSLSESARPLLDDLWVVPLEGGLDETLPCQAYSVAWVAAAQARGVPTEHEPVTRVQGASGHWLSLRGTPTTTENGDLAHIVVTIEPSRPDDIMTMIAIAYDLTQREREVFAELQLGGSIEETAARMFISPHTLRTHVRSLFAKTGCSSRGELLSRLYVHRAA